MQILRIAATAALVTGAGLGLAAPANAELTEGSYEAVYTANGKEYPIPWDLSSCGAGCLRKPGAEGSDIEFRRQGSAWVATLSETTDSGRTVTCSINIDNDSLAGIDHGCMLSAPPQDAPVFLRKTG